MSSRPAPRTSKLAGYARIQPTPAAAADLEDGAPAKASTSPKVKATFRLDADLMDQARAAFWQCGPQTGVSSLAEWVQEAIADKLARDMDTYNDGKPFTPVPTGRIPTGRR